MSSGVTVARSCAGPMSSSRGFSGMVPRVKVLSVFAVTLFITASTIQAQRRPIRDFDRTFNTLTVTVRDSKGLPVADARVEVRAVMSTMGSVPGGYTDKAGVFEIANVSEGQYEVVVQKNLNQATERAEVGSGMGLVAVRLDDHQKTSEAGDATSVSLAQFQVPKKAREAFKKAQAAVDERKIDVAEKHIAKALELYPDYAEALTLRGILNLEEKNTEAAIDDLDHAVKTDPGYAMAYLALGAAFNMAGRYDEALRSLDRGIALKPQSWQAYFEIGKARIGKAEYAAAIRSLDKAQSLANGKYPLVHLAKAHAMLALKNYPDAMNELQAFIDQAPKAPQADSARETLQQVRTFVAQQ
jgi:tetratricopeptide (TPR) repeat protein